MSLGPTGFTYHYISAIGCNNINSSEFRKQFTVSHAHAVHKHARTQRSSIESFKFLKTLLHNAIEMVAIKGQVHEEMQLKKCISLTFNWKEKSMIIYEKLNLIQ